MRLLLDVQGAQGASRVRGIGRHTRSLALALAQHPRGHAVSVLLNGALGNGDDLRTEFAAVLPAESILTFDPAGPVAEKDSANDWRRRAAEFQREAFIARHAPDVVHVGSVVEGFLDDSVSSIGSLVAPHASAASFYDLIPLMDPARYLGNTSYRRFYMRRLQSLKRADLLLALSQASRHEALDLLHAEPDQVVVVGCGVDARFRPLDLTSGAAADVLQRFALPRPFILYVGAVDPRKNIEALLHAFALLPPAIRAGYCLAVAGPLEPSERGRVHALRARYGLREDEVAFCGHVSDDELVLLYNACSLFVMPSRHEGFGLPPLEAMACGAPVLAADTTSLPEVVGRADLLFDPDRHADLARKAAAILGDAGVAAELRRWGPERAAAFTWAEVARRTLDAFEALHHRKAPTQTMVAGLARRPRLAFLSPLPGDETGIASYSAELLPELSRFYEIECVVDGTTVTDDWILANVTLRDTEFFERNAGSYDRIVYNFGNSHFHAGMFDLLRRVPGVVLLHDFYLSDVLSWMSGEPRFPEDTYPRELYLTHGLSALLARKRDGHDAAVVQYACNGSVFQNATGVIVHSTFAVGLAQGLFGPSVADDIAVVPHLRAPLNRLDRRAARMRLGIADDEFLVCSFGNISPLKLSDLVLEAWDASALNRASASLVFVGAADGAFGRKLKAAIARRSAKSQVSVTGYATRETYLDYLAAADVAVQLRSKSRGETSGTILDCLAAALPVVANAHGSAVELPPDAICQLSDAVQAAELGRALVALASDRVALKALGERGRAHLVEHNSPSRVGARFHAAVERLATTSRQAGQQVLLAACGEFVAAVSPTEADLTDLAVSLNRGMPRLGPRQILCDVTVLAEHDSKTGIQRVVRSVLTTLLDNPPPGYRVEPVRIDGGRYRYARAFAQATYDVPASVLPDTEVSYAEGDIFLGLDWVPDRLPHVVSWLERFRSAGGKAAFVIYDLLPLTLPQFFPGFMEEADLRWFEATLAVADQYICISRAVAADVARFARALGGARVTPLAIDWFHMGSDLAGSLPTTGRSSATSTVVSALQRRKSFLIVGTVEPRKGHRQVLDAFDALWREGTDVCLVVVGKRGWMVDDIARGIERHPEFGRRLFWLSDVSDEALDLVYGACTALIAASYGEGFGLPLVEGAQHGLALIARDIEVFREVAGEHAFYFSGEQPGDLSSALTAWLRLDAAGRAPRSTKLPRQTWKDATERLVDALLGDAPYETVQFSCNSTGSAAPGDARP